MKAVVKTVVLLVLLTLASGGCDKSSFQFGSEFQNSAEFKEATEKVGFGNAVILHQDKFGEGFWKGLNFQQWMDIYAVAKADSDLEKGR